MSIVLFDNDKRKKLYPLNNACATAALRVGILTGIERWKLLTNERVYVATEEQLSLLYEPIPVGVHTWVDATVLPDEDLANRIMMLEDNEGLGDTNGLIACKKNILHNQLPANDLLSLAETIYDYAETKRMKYAWHLFKYNDTMLHMDFRFITNGRKSLQIPETNNVINPENVFIEEGATIAYSIINASAGPVYIGKNAQIMEGCLIRGPLALCDGSVLKMGTKIYGATTLGPCCVGGGEIKNSILQGYSNKAHDGYLGDAVVGSWCNLGAGTTNSNLKNNAGVVKMWNSHYKDYIEADVKCGFIMGDYTRTAINTSINTGTTIGTCCNIFNDGILPKYIPDFEWGGKGLTKYELEKSFRDIDNWKKMKGQSLTDAEKIILQHIFEKL